MEKCPDTTVSLYDTDSPATYLPVAPHVKPARKRTWLWGLLIALCFGVFALRTIGGYQVVQSDAARHAMNGVFLHDWIAQGKLTRPLEFARTYYGHLPALSLPYHPPMFPLVEAGFYFLFGVNAFAARLAVAIAVAVSAFLLFRLVRATHNSVFLAAVSTVTFLCLPEAVWLGSDVMLEFPALVLTVAAMACLRVVDTQYTMRRALAFAVLAGAAVWTKQQTVFLGAVPFLYFAFLGRWRLFRKPAIWVSSALFAILVGGLSALSLPFDGAGVNHALPASATRPHRLTYAGLIVRNLSFYWRHYYDVTGPAGVVLVAALAVAIVTRRFRRRPMAVYAAWTTCSLIVLLLIRPFATRYLFFTYPAIIVLGYAGLIHVVTWLSGSRRWAMAAAVLLALVSVLWKMPTYVSYMHGPADVAQMLVAAKARRILYCGGSDGNFIFHYRALQPDLRTTIITGDKLPAKVFTASGLEDFAHAYGVEYIVLEDAWGFPRKRPWAPLVHSPPPSMIAVRDIKLASSTVYWNGTLRVFRFINPSTHPKQDLSMRTIGGTMNFNLAQ